MRTIKTALLTTALAVTLAAPAFAGDDMGHDMAKEHGGQVFHMFRLARILLDARITQI